LVVEAHSQRLKDFNKSLNEEKTPKNIKGDSKK
jgi:hypothetical protein